MQKGVFVCFFLLFGGFVFLCFFCLETNQKGYFPATLELFLFCVPKRPVFKILIFFLFCFLFWFSFCIFFQNSMFCSLFINPFWKTLICLVFLSFFCLPFPFLMFACFFQTNFPNIPFLFCCFSFHVSCFCLSNLMLALFWYVLFCSCLVFVLFLVLLSQTLTKHCFPCNSRCF